MAGFKINEDGATIETKKTEIPSSPDLTSACGRFEEQASKIEQLQPIEGES